MNILIYVSIWIIFFGFFKIFGIVYEVELSRFVLEYFLLEMIFDKNLIDFYCVVYCLYWLIILLESVGL